jgi:hypothetical protein
MSPARIAVLRTSSRSTCLSRLIASRLSPCCLRRRSCACGLADEAGGRRHHRFGNAGAAGIEQVAERTQPRRDPQEVVLREVGDLLLRPHRAEHAADPDPRIGRWRQAGLVAGLQARNSGAPCSDSASPRLMPTSGLSAVTVSSCTSPSMP